MNNAHLLIPLTDSMYACIHSHFQLRERKGDHRDEDWRSRKSEYISYMYVKNYSVQHSIRRLHLMRQVCSITSREYDASFV